MNIEDLVLVEVFAEGYYSGQTETVAVVMSKEFVEEHIDNFGTVYFSELDGKHSEVEGDISTKQVNEENIKLVISCLLTATGDDYHIWEEMLGDISESEVEKQITINREFNARIKSKVLTTYYLDGVEL